MRHGCIAWIIDLTTCSGFDMGSGAAVRKGQGRRSQARDRAASQFPIRCIGQIAICDAPWPRCPEGISMSVRRPLLLPLRSRCWPWPAAARRPKQAAAPPPPTVTVAKPIAAHDHRPGRICRPLRRRGNGRGPRPRLRLSGQDAFPGRPDRQAGRPPVHDRQAAVPEHARPGPGQPCAGEVQPRLHRGRLCARAAAGARPHHHRADLRSARAGQSQRARHRCRPTRHW